MLKHIDLCLRLFFVFVSPFLSFSFTLPILELDLESSGLNEIGSLAIGCASDDTMIGVRRALGGGEVLLW